MSRRQFSTGNVRWRDDVGWEMRCECCALSKLACWWPLTDEFWRKYKSMSRCRSCWNVYEREARAKIRRHRPVSAAVAAARRAYCAEWAARKRQRQREAEGRGLYERRKAA